MVWNSFKEVMILGQGLREEYDQNACWEGERLCPSQNTGSKWRVQVWEGTDRAWRLGGTCTKEQLDAWGAASRNSFRPSLLIKIF